jgi:hypothetical protein
VVFERIEGGKIRATTSSWDDAKVLLVGFLSHLRSLRATMFRRQGTPMETREILLKADKVSVVFEHIAAIDPNRNP